MTNSNGQGRWLGFLAIGSLSSLANGGSGNFAAWMGSAGFGICAILALVLFFHARMQLPCWQLERKTGREFYKRQRHALLGLSSVYWAAPFGMASLALAWVAVRNAH